MKDVRSYVIKTIKAKFPDLMILPAIGNNDCEYHYQPPNYGPNEEEYYNTSFREWFTSHKPNQRFSKKIWSTFKKGGYYRVEINEELTVITLNS